MCLKALERKIFSGEIRLRRHDRELVYKSEVNQPGKSYRSIDDADEASVHGAELLLRAQVVDVVAFRSEAGVVQAEHSAFDDLLLALKVGAEDDLALVVAAET